MLCRDYYRYGKKCFFCGSAKVVGKDWIILVGDDDKSCRGWPFMIDYDFGEEVARVKA